MGEYSPADIGDIVSWDKDEKFVRTSLGDLPYIDIERVHGHDWVVVKMPWKTYAPIAIGLWEERERRASL